MVEIKVFSDIGQGDELLMSLFGIDNKFNADTVHRVFDENPNENDFKFIINCDGGSVAEGLRIYDVIRTSGKNIHCNIENSCHSMAIILLLAAPKNQRTANKNCRALIHEVRCCVLEDATADQLRTLASDLDKEQKAILDIYTERTGYDRAKLEQLMKDEKMLSSDELKRYGFISQINAYTTNKFTNSKTRKTMSKNAKSILINKATSFLKKIENLLAEVVNYDFTDADGNVLFSTEREDDTLEVGDAVVIPDGATEGTFELEDGRTVTVAEGAITEITEPEGDEELENLRAENEQLRNSLRESQTLIVELTNQIGSNYTPQNRMRQPGKNGTKPTSEEKKNQAKANLAKMKGGK